MAMLNRAHPCSVRHTPSVRDARAVPSTRARIFANAVSREVEVSSPNGENPLVHGAIPILGCDVWEHSYYIDYRNRRPDYLKAFVDHLVNWEYVDQLFSKV